MTGACGSDRGATLSLQARVASVRRWARATFVGPRPIPYLTGGRYVGVDISPTMLRKAAACVAVGAAGAGCRVTWLRQRDARFPVDDASVDVLCAFSVFTHMEHEDTFLYLTAARRVMRSGGRLVFSCLPVGPETTRRVFIAEAQGDFRWRWKRVRNVITSVELIETVASLAGWTPVRWYAGDEPIAPLRGRPGDWALGQSTCVLEA